MRRITTQKRLMIGYGTSVDLSTNKYIFFGSYIQTPAIYIV